MGVGAVERQEHLSPEIPEEHTVAAVLQEKRIRLGKMPVNFTVVRNGKALGIAFFRKAGPEAKQGSVLPAPQEGTVGHMSGDPGGM